MKRFTLFVSLIVVLSFLLSACGGGAPAPTEAQESVPTEPPSTEPPAPEPTEPPAGPLVLKYASSANVTTWDPVASFSTEAAYMANMYEQLLRVNPPDSAERFTPLLAESWERSDDGLVWTFKLRPGVKFHDGETLNADAVVKSIETAREKAGASFIWLPLDKVEAVDDMTVQFTLKWPQPLELILGSEYAAYIVSPKALDAAAADENYWSNGLSAGTGPYMLESYTPDQEIVLTRNPDYWGGWEAGQYDKVLASIVPEATTRQQMLEGGEADIVTTVPADSVESFQSNPEFTVSIEPSLFNYTAFFNTLKPPLDNATVRQALAYATPYEDIINIGANGRGAQSYGAAPDGVFPHSKEVMQYPYDLEKARELLKEAGYEDGFPLRLTYASENSIEETFAPLIKDSYAQIGVDVTIEPMQFNEQWTLAKTDPASAQDIFVLLYWPTYSDAGADNLWSMFYGTMDAPHLNATNFNLSYWYNEQYNALMDEASGLSGTDMEASLAKYTEAQNLLVEESPAAHLFDAKVVAVYPNDITGFKYNLNYPDVRYWFYDLKPAE